MKKKIKNMNMMMVLTLGIFPVQAADRSEGADIPDLIDNTTRQPSSDGKPTNLAIIQPSSDGKPTNLAIIQPSSDGKPTNLEIIVDNNSPLTPINTGKFKELALIGIMDKTGTHHKPVKLMLTNCDIEHFRVRNLDIQINYTNTKMQNINIDTGACIAINGADCQNTMTIHDGGKLVIGDPSSLGKDKDNQQNLSPDQFVSAGYLGNIHVKGQGDIVTSPGEIPTVLYKTLSVEDDKDGAKAKRYETRMAQGTPGCVTQ